MFIKINYPHREIKWHLYIIMLYYINCHRSQICIAAFIKYIDDTQYHVT